ncbi:secreted RxLR effector protein 161-like, partial [Bidens hawaiensis]|uniref:secreted RxLR effector protein 161-like n=1 Tax=Bidens hawaiensis TaxID=980011 RepID=UPI00404A6113
MKNQFEMSDLGLLNYYLGIEVSQDEDGIRVKQEAYAWKILKEAVMENCNKAYVPMDPNLRLSKAEDEDDVDPTEYRKLILRYVKATTVYGIKYCRDKGVLNGYSDSSHNIDEDDMRCTTGHVFYLGLSPITWCSQKQGTVALSSCEAEYMAASAAACQAVWLRDL